MWITKKKLYLLNGVAIILGLVAGYMIGMSQAYATCIDIASKLLDIEFKPSMIVDFPKLMRYIN